MASIWAESVGAALDDGLITLALAVGVCDEGTWVSSMWPVPDRDAAQELHGPDGLPVTDAEARHALVQRFSAPWSVAWHALEVVDYDLTGELAPWVGPPAPFAGHPHWRDFTSLARPWTQDEVLGYVEVCRQRAREVFATLDDERAATPLPSSHRRGPTMTYARLLAGLAPHTVEHASQILQHVNARAGGPT
jgi:hypothetical protein